MVLNPKFALLPQLALRQLFHIKNPYYHRVLNPSDSLCSNDYLLSLAHPLLPLISTSLYQKIFDKRNKYLGHILRHPDSPEYKIIFNPQERSMKSPWPESA